jgi:hypothetical protein
MIMFGFLFSRRSFFCLLALPLFIPASIFGAHSQEVIPTLEPGKMIERQLNGGETQTFQISLSAGHFLSVIVEQRGIDIELKLSDPEQKNLIATDALNITQGPEVAALIAAQNGPYHIDIVSPSKSAPSGTYQIKILALRPATEPDHRWLMAQQFYIEGKQLSEQTSAEAQAQAAQKFTEALRAGLLRLRVGAVARRWAIARRGLGADHACHHP